MLYVDHARLAGVVWKGVFLIWRVEEREIGGVENIVNLRDPREGTEQWRNDPVSMSVFICAELKTD